VSYSAATPLSITSTLSLSIIVFNLYGRRMVRVHTASSRYHTYAPVRNGEARCVGELGADGLLDDRICLHVHRCCGL
jgi:hypothetical protein